MSLIELIDVFVEFAKIHRIDDGVKWLEDAGVNPDLINHIVATVDDDGNIIGSDGRKWKIDLIE